MNEAVYERGPKTGPSLIEGLFAVGAHYGSLKSRRHPSFAQFVFTSKNGSDVIDLEKTGAQLNHALETIAALAREGKKILFVGTKPEARRLVEEAGTALAASFVTERWVGGMLTNFRQMRKRVERLQALTEAKERGDWQVYTKKEQMLLEEERKELERNFKGIASLLELPAALFVIDPRHEKIAVTEARALGIPVFALAGSDCDLVFITHPIPGNDATIASIAFFLDRVKEAFASGQKEREKAAEEKAAASVAEAAAPAAV